MADDQLRRLLKERRGWKRAQTAFQNRQARSGDKEMAQLDMLMRRGDETTFLTTRDRARVAFLAQNQWHPAWQQN